MSRLLKEIRFGEGIRLTILGQEIIIMPKRSRFTDRSVKLVVEADPSIPITGIAGINRQDG